MSIDNSVIDASRMQATHAVDALRTEIPRAGLHRLVPNRLLCRLETELKRRGYLKHLERA
jgi:hypothetical protein